MIILNGKYNFAKVMLPNDIEEYVVVLESGFKETRRKFKYLDPATQGQIESFLNHPSFAKSNIVVMPDTHYGKGSCVGFTMPLNSYIIPNIIGVDIGCGIIATNLGKFPIDTSWLRDMDEFIKSEVPSGFNLHKKPVEWYLDELDLEFACKELNLDLNKVQNSVGTLGGGNHFVELGVDEEGNVWLTIHSGSRNLGLKVANHFQKIADTNCKSYFQDFGDLNFLHAGNEDAQSYIHYMNLAQHYANMNRRTMTRIIMEGFIGNVNFLDQIDSVHNYIDFNDNIIRKGATAAHEGQRLVIPFNMEEGLIIGTGKGNKNWNYSAPHGAGRIKSRKKAKEELNLEDAQQGMENAGVFTTSLNNSTLDEAKGAYKDKELILKMIEDTVEVTNFVKPVYNFKAGDKNG